MLASAAAMQIYSELRKANLIGRSGVMKDLSEITSGGYGKAILGISQIPAHCLLSQEQVSSSAIAFPSWLHEHK